MKTFNEFEATRSHLLNAYDCMLSSGILPIEETGIAQVEERRSDLLSGRFILAICGRIKAGKSTLVNSLLFQAPVLPTDDTPHTAKNTLIEFGEKESLKATFYNSQEWAVLNAEMAQSTNEVARKFYEELEAVANEGIYKDECIRPAALTRTNDSLSTLHEYVTPVIKGGKFTPFVKEVTVFYPHPWLRSVTVADTPGVDDPYKFREDQTKRFVTQAGSILYVTYAGQAMAKQDFDFLNEYLLHVPKQKRVIAVNKIDVLDGGREELEAYLEALSTHSEPSIREVFGTRGSIAFVCSLAGLIAQMESSGYPLSDDLRWYRNKLDAAGLLNAKANGIDALRAMVEERLVTLKGKDFIDGHTSFLYALLDRRHRFINNLMTVAKARLEDLGKTQEELKRQIADIERELVSLQSDFEQQKKSTDRVVKQCFTTLRCDLLKLGSTILEKTRAELDCVDNIDVLPNQAAWFFTRYFDEKTLELKLVMDSCITQVERCIKEFSVKMKGKWTKWDSAPALDDMLDYSTFSAIRELQDKTRKIAEVQGFEKIREDNTGVFQRFFNTKRGRDVTKTKILTQITKTFDECLMEKSEHATQIIKDELRGNMKKMEDSLNAVLRSRRGHKENLVSGQTDRDVERQKIQEEIKVLEEGFALVETLKNYVHIPKTTAR